MDREQTLRRVVTGRDRDGKSIIALDDKPEAAALGGMEQAIFRADTTKLIGKYPRARIQ